MSLKYTFFLLFIINILSKVLGFFRESILAYFYGTSSLVDIYILATSIPTIIFGCLDAIAVAITPGYIKAKEEGEYKANQIVAITISVLIIATCVTCLFFEIFIEELLIPYSNSMGIKEKENLILFTRITVMVVMFNPITQCLLSLLRCKEKYEVASGIELLISSIQIVFIIISGIKYKTILLPIGYLVSHLSCMIVAIIITKEVGICWRFTIKNVSLVKEIYYSAFPIFISSTIVQINAFIDKSFASTLPGGSVSSLGYANTLKNLIYSLFTVMIINVFYPTVSENIVKKKISQAVAVMNRCLSSLILFLAPILVFSYIYANEIVGVIYERGSFDSKSTSITVGPFRMYILGLLAISIRDIILRYYYSIGIKKKVVVFSFITISVNIILNILFIKRLEHIGLALATSISALVCVPLYFVFLPSKYRLNSRELLFNIYIYFGISIVSGIISRIIMNKLGIVFSERYIMKLLELFVALIIVVCIYVINVFALCKFKYIRIPFGNKGDSGE